MATLIVHGRDPARLVRELGRRGALSVAASLLGTVLSCLLGPPLLALVAVEAWAGTLFSPATPVWWLFVAASAALLAGGAVAAAWPALVGLGRIGRPDLAAWLALLPVHLFLVSVAAWLALAELLLAPQRWNKTEHGLARRRPRNGQSHASKAKLEPHGPGGRPSQARAAHGWRPLVSPNPARGPRVG